MQIVLFVFFATNVLSTSKKKINPKEIALLNKQILNFCFSTIIASFSWKESLIICKLYVWNIFK